MKKIIHLASVHNRTDNRVFFKQCIDIARNGYNVNLIVADGFGDEVLYGVKIIDFSFIKSKSRFLRIFLTSPYVALKTLKIRADLYHIHDPELLFYFKLFSIFFGPKKVIFDMHENLSEQIKSKNWIPKFLRGVLSNITKKYEDFNLKNVPVIYAEKSYSKYFPNISQYETILNYPKSIWINSAEEKTINKIPVIGYIGRVGFDRGADLLINSVANINKNNIQLRLQLIGKIPFEITEMSNFKYLVKSNLLDCPGFITNDKAIEYVHKWDIGFCVLKNKPNFIESYPTKIFEYFASGVPVITSNFPLYTQLINDFQGGICIRPESGEDLVEAIYEIINKPNKYKPNFHNGISWDSQLDKLLKFYKKLI